MEARMQTEFELDNLQLQIGYVPPPDVGGHIEVRREVHAPPR